MNNDFWERIDKLEELAIKLASVYDGTTIPINELELIAEFAHATNPAMIREMVAEIRRLEKEANWLADRLPKNFRQGDEPVMNTKYWREAARKAVENK